MTQSGHPASSAVDGGRFRRAIELIDAANADDPSRVTVGGVSRPKEIAHAELLTEWIERLRPDPSEPLLLAARAHHIQRWRVPRSTYPDGRRGYLRWRRDLHQFHAERVGEILHQCGYDEQTITRVQALVRKYRLTSDPEVQTLEDGLCLVFLETQLDEVGDRIDDEKMVEVLRKTWRKMTPAGREAALRLGLSEHGRGLVERALAGP